MSAASTAQLTVFIVLALPLLWSAVAHVLRALFARRVAPAPMAERAEQTALWAMIAPALLGAVLVALAWLAPERIAAAPLIAFADGGGLSRLGGGVASASEDAARMVPFAPLILIAYAAGAAFMGARLVRDVAALRGIVARAERAQARSGGAILITKERVTPFVSWCGRIVMPEALMTQLPPDELALLVAHERAHVHRGDGGYFLLLAWLAAAFWFNPLVLRQIRRCRLCAELECDAAVARGAPMVRRAYAKAFVAAVTLLSVRTPHSVPSIRSASRSGEHRMRLAAILRPSPDRPRRLSPLAAIALALAAAPVTALQVACAKTAPSTPTFSVMPLDGCISSAYGERSDPFTGRARFHHGVDIAAPLGEPIAAPAAGRVRRAEEGVQGYGNVLEIDHGGGVVSRYGQLSAIDVALGDVVAAGQTIARVGSTGRSTGPHLHLEIWKDGETLDPADVVPLPVSEPPAR